MARNGLISIFRTRRIKTTGRGQNRRHDVLICPDKCQEYCFNKVFDILPRYPVKNVFQKRKKCLSCQMGSSFFYYDIYIPAACNFVPVQPEIFTGKAFDPVACCSMSDFFGYGNTKACPLIPPLSEQGNETPVLKFSSEL